MRFSAAILASVTVLLVVGAGFASASAPTPTPTPTPDPTGESVEPVRIQFLGRFSFLIIAPDGTRFVTDPYWQMPYDFPTGVQADVVTISHTHHDHSAYWLVEGDPIVINDLEPRQFGMTTITGYPSWHGMFRNQDMGPNTIYVFQIGDVKLVHLGDLKVIEEEEIYDAITDADVVLANVGVAATLTHPELWALLERIQARTVVAAHWFVPAENVIEGVSLKVFLKTIPPDLPLVEVDELLVEPEMPNQVVVIAQGPLEE
jgi:L-ascorbate metabolism protein UlaG (beta-lactamase superfamily)